MKLRDLWRRKLGNVGVALFFFAIVPSKLDMFFDEICIVHLAVDIVILLSNY